MRSARAMASPPPLDAVRVASKPPPALPAVASEKPAKRRRSTPAPAGPSAFAVYAEPRAVTPPPALAELPPPFVAPQPGRWRERYASCCSACFALGVPCLHHAETRLRCLLIGHNPSTHAWASGLPYSNPTNRFWKLCAAAGVVPLSFTAQDADSAPAHLGLGITDVGCEPGSDAGEYKRATMLAWRAELYDRLRGHLLRCAAWAAVGPHCAADFAPRVVAFAGKRQWGALFQPPLPRVPSGLQAPESRPPGWPLPASSEVWVLPSPSGRAVLTAEEREGPYRLLGARLAELGWPE